MEGQGKRLARKPAIARYDIRSTSEIHSYRQPASMEDFLLLMALALFVHPMDFQHKWVDNRETPSEPQRKPVDVVKETGTLGYLPWYYSGGAP